MIVLILGAAAPPVVEGFKLAVAHVKMAFGAAMVVRLKCKRIPDPATPMLALVVMLSFGTLRYT